jgi:transcriptional regulator with GAF, ATPase, and Fis domain
MILDQRQPIRKKKLRKLKNGGDVPMRSLKRYMSKCLFNETSSEAMRWLKQNLNTDFITTNHISYVASNVSDFFKSLKDFSFLNVRQEGQMNIDQVMSYTREYYKSKETALFWFEQRKVIISILADRFPLYVKANRNISINEDLKLKPFCCEYTPDTLIDCVEILQYLDQNIDTMHSPQMTQDSPQMTQNSPQMTRDSPQMARDSSQMTQNSPQMTQDSYQMTRDSSQMTQNSPQMAQDSPQMTQNSPQMIQLGDKSDEMDVFFSSFIPEIETSNSFRDVG